MGAAEIAKLAKAGYPFDGDLITALPIRRLRHGAAIGCRTRR